jgi:uncharacterized protein with HEPN domain
MSKRDTQATLSQILHHAQLAEQLCHGRTLPEFVKDWKSALALERILEIIGEAVKRLPSEVCASHTQVEWRLVAGMRDRLSHGYDDVDYEILWNVVQGDLPNLIETVEQMLSEVGEDLG